jgi:hypothetical protein
MLAMQGCGKKSATKEEKSYASSFDFTPPSMAQAGSEEVTFVILSASYRLFLREKDHWRGIQQTEKQLRLFTDLSKSIGIDLQEIVTARGFSERGLFNSYDEIPSTNKKDSDLVLQPTLEINLELLNTTYKEHINILGSNKYTLKGEIAVDGRVSLSLMEGLSGKSLWLKSVELPRTVSSWEGEKEYYNPPTLWEIDSLVDLSDPGITETLGKTMEAFYSEIMQAAWNYLDPKEVKAVISVNRRKNQ